MAHWCHVKSDAEAGLQVCNVNTGETTANLCVVNTPEEHCEHHRRTLFHGACEEIACWLFGWLRARNFAA